MYYLYILQCADSTLYTGITVDLVRRIKEHNTSSLGAKYTHARRPVKLIYFRKFHNRSTASKAEYKIKNLSREEKLGIIKNSRYNKNTSLLTNTPMGKGDNRDAKNRNKKKPKKAKK